MITTATYGPVRVFSLGRTLGPWVPYITHAFQAGRVLIDTGTRYARRELLAAIEGKIDIIINTHHHEDHIGNNHAVQSRHGCAIYAHAAALDAITDTGLILLRPYQHLVWGRPCGSRAMAAGPIIDTGDRVFSVIPCAGHCDDHICLYDARAKVLFTGDMFCGVRNVFLRQDEDFYLQLDSVKHLASLDVDTLFCGLKGAVPDGAAALKAKVQFMEKIRDDVLDLNLKGLGAAAIGAKLLGREGIMRAVTAGHFSKTNLVRSILQQRPTPAA
jgi:glyoxylase-like metal-dependent hydrolase (beta-lactamase superfamily II)